MNTKEININEPYFLASFKYNKSKPEDFGLKKVKGKDEFEDEEGNLWKNEILWDLGWGNEYGFVKLPEPSFEQLWILLTESNIEFNQLGSAEMLSHYPEKLKVKLQKLFTRKNKINRELTKRLSHLDILNHVMNHSETTGKNIEQINADFEEWKNLKEDFEKKKTESLTTRIIKTVTNN